VALHLPGKVWREPGQRPSPDLAVDFGGVGEADDCDGREKHVQHGEILRGKHGLRQQW
jgi:hypothetical protein